jgi:hypothetical protein
MVFCLLITIDLCSNFYSNFFNKFFNAFILYECGYYLNPAAVPFKDFKRTKEVQKPQVIWLSGFFIVQRNPVKYSGIQSKVCLLV